MTVNIFSSVGQIVSVATSMWHQNSLCCCLVAKSCLPLLRPHGLQPARLLCPWGFPAKKTGAGCHLLLQGIFPTQGSNPRPLHWQVNPLPLSHQGSPFKKGICLKILFSPHIPQRSYFIGEEMEVQKTCGQNHRISSLQNSDQVFFSVYQEVSLWENRLKKKKAWKSSFRPIQP